jgi:hypothetical protein
MASVKSSCALAAALLCLGSPVMAESLGSAASSASSAGSASVGSLSDSVQGSSNSSAGDPKTAQGTYRVTEVAKADDGSARVVLRLEPLREGATAADALTVKVPAQALAQQPIVAGDAVQVNARAYGLAFARTTSDGAAQPFFLALTQTWQREMGSRAL